MNKPTMPDFSAMEGRSINSGKIPPPIHIPVMAGEKLNSTPAPGTDIYTPQIDVGMHMGVK